MSMSLRSRSVRFAIAAAALGLVAGSAAAVSAAGGGGGAARDGGEGPNGAINEQLSGYEETPLALSTGGNGTFRAMVTDAGIEYRLTYADTVDVTQAHIHFGAAGQIGGISVFLCTNLGKVLSGRRRARRPASVRGPSSRSDVIGAAAAQGIAADGVRGAARRHPDRLRRTSTCTAATYGGGEIRGQIETVTRAIH